MTETSNGKEARWWQRLESTRVECQLCPWHCRLDPGQTGRCGARQNVGGALHSLNYGQITSMALDPIEKKPLYHFFPGSGILSVGSFGCNLSCAFCQNWQISTQKPSCRYLQPEGLAELAVEQQNQGSIGIAYTYNEPMVSLEYVIDTARLVARHNLQNVLVTNGIVEQEPLEELLQHVDAMNVDIKAMDDQFYKELCGGLAAPARRTVEQALAADCHVEITNLLIPGHNDSDEQIQALVDWAADLSPTLPLHFSAYRPAHRLQVPPTPRESLERAYDIAARKLQFIYVGNMYIGGTTDTRCPDCGAVVVRRDGFSASREALNNGRCSSCGAELNIRQ
jgi:pyruvate formate lyase activating enzyme